jgi:diguanylate cyclase (GGDEF)-like protein
MATTCSQRRTLARRWREQSKTILAGDRFMTFASMAPLTPAGVGLAVALLACVVCIVVMQRRLAHRTRELEHEISRRKHAEEELDRVRAGLETQVRLRTQALERRNDDLTRLRLALETANQRLKRLVAVDALTGIANRRQFDRALERELRRTRREQQPLSLIFLDLDGFKRFNDTYGHARGDEVLRSVARTLDETFRRGGDLVARYGGEEFAVVLPGIDGRRAALYAERLRRRVWCLNIPYGASQSGDRVTISAGVATAEQGHVATADQLMLSADRALYRAKCLGKNRIVTASIEDAVEDSQAIA